MEMLRQVAAIRRKPESEMRVTCDQKYQPTFSADCAKSLQEILSVRITIVSHDNPGSTGLSGCCGNWIGEPGLIG